MLKKFLIVVCILESLVIGYLIYDRRPVTPNIPIVDVIVKDSIIRDSIYIVNDSIRTEIKYIKQEHKKDSTYIMSVNDSALFDLFSRYIEDYNNK